MSASQLPGHLDAADGLILRRWKPADAEALGAAIAESLEHLQPWMEWAADEPVPLEVRRARIAEWDREWRSGGDVVLGVFAGGRIAGGCGLHRRLGPNGLEIGYWTHAAFLRQGIATAAARALTDAALAVPHITHVEIHHDQANVASAGVPRRLGYHLMGEAADRPAAPAEVGIECRWRMTKADWAALKPRA